MSLHAEARSIHPHPVRRRSDQGTERRYRDPFPPHRKPCPPLPDLRLPRVPNRGRWSRGPRPDRDPAQQRLGPNFDQEHLERFSTTKN